MLIGTQYSDNKIYRGVRHYDGLPFTSEDIQEYSDTLYMKSAYLMNNIVGYGVLNSPAMSISSAGIRLAEPAIVLIDGDISLIQSDDNTPIINKSAIKSAGITRGSVCIAGWYQHLRYSSVLRNYGGVDNSILPNDLADNEFHAQISTRYQFRWAPIIIDTDLLESDEITFNFSDRDEAGELTGDYHSITSHTKKDNIFLSDVPDTMDYALSDMYIVPICKYEYSTDEDIITGVYNYLPVKPKGSSGFIKSDTEPTGEYTEGTTWYNPITREFKHYVVGEGFVDSASTMGFLQYQSIYTMTEDVSTPQDVIVPINISELESGDILQVVYEGLVLVATEQYEVDYINHTIKLLGFTVRENDKVTFTVTKIVEATDITNITSQFTRHLLAVGSDTIQAHVKLSDNIDNTLDSRQGVAATPKAVYQATLIRDSANNIDYKFVVENGILYLEEV